MRILGLDPGLEHTGFGVIEVVGNQYGFVAAGRITTQVSDPLAVRLVKIADGIGEVLQTFRPHEAAVEEVFININGKSSLKLGQARGIALMVPQQKGVPVHEYAARLVKKSLVGTGKAEKAQVAHMVKVLLPRAVAASADAFDALAVALTHAHHRGMAIKLSSIK
ncbi:MAG: crossover junction endodeoxyribonuclease RuvC [Proteobacteria bacterium]|nr:crossover junction endodeoxyribonuclease RuvC [Pseudomonadota bacterium]NBX85872.1 crossover junction endodeoxyribonuclease RuvC [Pseudomonadota bacterium]